jgi:outer membrane protein assembly factor BamB
MTRWTTAESGDTAFGGATETPPVAADGAILAYIGGDLSAIDASSGRVRWQAERTQRRPAVRDGTVYALGLGTVHGFDLASGTHHTVATVDDGLRSVTAAPDRLLVGTGDSLLGISYDGTTEWTYAPDGRSSLEAVAPAVADGVAYASFAVDDTDRLLALDARDGTALWDVPLSVEGGGGGHAALAVSEEMVYLPTPEGVVGLDRSDGRVRWTFDADTLYPWSSVALADGRVYAFAEKTLYALEEA